MLGKKKKGLPYIREDCVSCGPSGQEYQIHNMVIMTYTEVPTSLLLTVDACK